MSVQMTSVPFSIPTVLVPEALIVLALEMDVAVPQTGPAQIALFQGWAEKQLADKIGNYRQQQAATNVNLADLQAWLAS